MIVDNRLQIFRFQYWRRVFFLLLELLEMLPLRFCEFRKPHPFRLVYRFLVEGDIPLELIGRLVRIVVVQLLGIQDL